MATFKDHQYQDTKVELEFDLYPAPLYNEQVKWVGVTLILRFGDEYPEIVFTSECQELLHIEKFIKDMQQLSSGKIKRLSVIPWDPNFTLFIKAIEEDSGRVKTYKLDCQLDVAGRRGKEYYAVGPALHMVISSKELGDFIKNLEKDLQQFLKIYK